MISSIIIPFNWSFILALDCMGMLHLQCCIGGTLELSMMEYSPCILPILSKEPGNIFLRSSILCIIPWSCIRGPIAEWSCKECVVVLGSYKGPTGAAVDMFSLCRVCVLTVCSCLHWGDLLWHTTLSSPSCVLATRDTRTLFLVYTLKNWIVMDLPVRFGYAIIGEVDGNILIYILVGNTLLPTPPLTLTPKIPLWVFCGSLMWKSVMTLEWLCLSFWCRPLAPIWGYLRGIIPVSLSTLLDSKHLGLYIWSWEWTGHSMNSGGIVEVWVYFHHYFLCFLTLLYWFFPSLWQDLEWHLSFDLLSALLDGDFDGVWVWPYIASGSGNHTCHTDNHRLDSGLRCYVLGNICHRP